MTTREAFLIWARAGSKWVDWVRPVPFVMYSDDNINQILSFNIPTVNYISKLQADTAIFLDLPGYHGVNEGLALAKLGYRPIPLYNGTTGQQGATALVDNCGILSALIWGASVLKMLKLKEDAPPVFLLDSNRMRGHKTDATFFDNSWDLYAQDIPSPDYFIDSGICKITVRGEKMHRDLNRILYAFQSKGVAILFTSGFEKPKEITIKKPQRYTVM